MRVERLAQKHNGVAPARARTLTVRSGAQRTNCYHALIWICYISQISALRDRALLQFITEQTGKAVVCELRRFSPDPHLVSPLV